MDFTTFNQFGPVWATVGVLLFFVLVTITKQMVTQGAALTKFDEKLAEIATAMTKMQLTHEANERRTQEMITSVLELVKQSAISMVEMNQNIKIQLEITKAVTAESTRVQKRVDAHVDAISG
jgi:ACT domain-containing protein